MRAGHPTATAAAAAVAAARHRPAARRRRPAAQRAAVRPTARRPGRRWSQRARHRAGAAGAPRARCHARARAAGAGGGAAARAREVQRMAEAAAARVMELCGGEGGSPVFKHSQLSVAKPTGVGDDSDDEAGGWIPPAGK